jgi:hypothetical protein
MSRLVAYRAAVVSTVRSWLPDLARCEPHMGRFDEKELARLGVNTPAVLVAVLGAPSATDVGNDERDQVVRTAAIVVTSDRRDLPRDEAALAIVEALLVRIPGQRWGQEDCHMVQHATVKAENLHSGEIDRRAIALWAVTWDQTIRLGEDIFADEGTLPAEVYVNGEPLVTEP